MKNKVLEKIDNKTFRIKIPTGWIVIFESDNGVSMTTILDPQYLWLREE